MHSKCMLLCNGNRVIRSNGLRAGDRNPVLRLRQGYGACTLLAVRCFSFICFVSGGQSVNNYVDAHPRLFNEFIQFFYC